MPATAGRVRMPANNRVHSSAALQTHGIWQSAIGYDPYAPNKDDAKNSAVPKASNSEPDADNPYNSYQGLLALARITNTNADEARGACKRCGRVGHLTFQCRNFLSIKEDVKEKDVEAIQASVMAELDRIKGRVGKVNGKVKGEGEDDSDEDEEEESDSSDSDADSEMERILASRYGKKVSDKGRSSRQKKRDDSDENGSDSDSYLRKREKRGRGRSKKRSGKRGHSDSEDEDEGKRKRRREKRRKRDESSDEEDERQLRRRKSRKEKRRRRSHRHDSDSSTSEDSGGRYERKSRRSAILSDSDASGSDDSRVGRGKKRSNKKSRKRHYRDYE